MDDMRLNKHPKIPGGYIYMLFAYQLRYSYAIHY